MQRIPWKRFKQSIRATKRCLPFSLTCAPTHPFNPFNSPCFKRKQGDANVNLFLGTRNLLCTFFLAAQQTIMPHAAKRRKWSQFNFICSGTRRASSIPKRDRNKFGTETHTHRKRWKATLDAVLCVRAQRRMCIVARSRRRRPNNTQNRSHISVVRSQIKIYAFVFVCRRYNCVIGYWMMWHGLFFVVLCANACTRFGFTLDIVNGNLRVTSCNYMRIAFDFILSVSLGKYKRSVCVLHWFTNTNGGCKKYYIVVTNVSERRRSTSSGRPVFPHKHRKWKRNNNNTQ